MSRLKKLLFGLFAVLLLLFVTFVILIRIYVTPERVRDLLQTSLEDSLHRKVSLGAVDVGLFSGVRLDQLRIAEQTGTEDFLYAENIDLSYDFSALLHGELTFGRILISDPKLRLERFPDGSLNISDLLGQTSVRNHEEQSSGTAPEDVSSPIPLLVKKFNLQNGSLSFIDRKLNSQSPYVYRLENLNLALDNFALDRPFTTQFSSRVNGATLAATVEYDVTAGISEMKIQVDKLDLVPFLPYLQDLLPGRLGKGRFTTEIHVKAEPVGMAIKGEIVLDQVDFQLASSTPLSWQKVRIAIAPDLLFQHDEKRIDINKLLVDINGTQLVYAGQLSLAEPVQVAGEASLNIRDLRQLTELLPLEIRQKAAAYGAAGSLKASLRLAGAPTGTDVVRQAKLEVSSLQASFGHLRPALNGTLNYALGSLTAKELTVDLQGQQIVADLDVSGVFNPLPVLKLLVSGKSLDVDALMANNQGSASAATSPAEEIRSEAQAEPLVIPFAGRTEFNFRQVLYKGVRLENLRAASAVRAGKIYLERLNADVSGGTLQVVAEAGLNDASLPFSGSFQLTDIQLGPLTDALLPEGRGSVSGVLLTSGRFSGAAGRSDLLTGLRLQGDFDLKNGEIKGSPLLSGLAQFLTNPELEVLGFSRYHGTYGLEGRQGSIDSKLESRKVLISPKGSFSLDGPLNLALETRVSPETMQKSGVGGKGADLLKDENGWSLLPLMIKGTYMKPRVAIDSSGAQKQIKEGVARELGKQLQKKLGSGADSQENQQMQKLLDGTLKKLFGN